MDSIKQGLEGTARARMRSSSREQAERRDPEADVEGARKEAGKFVSNVLRLLTARFRSSRLPLRNESWASLGRGDVDTFSLCVSGNATERSGSGRSTRKENDGDGQ